MSKLDDDDGAHVRLRGVSPINTQSADFATMIEAAMKRCIELAKEAALKGQYPLGALVIRDGVVLSECGSSLIAGNDPTAHPEMTAIRQAAQKLQSRYLEGAYLVTTFEPCPMCASAAIWAKMKGIAYGTSQSRGIDWYEKNKTSVFSFRQIYIGCKAVIEKGVPLLDVFPNVMEQECDALFDLVGKEARLPRHSREGGNP